MTDVIVIGAGLAGLNATMLLEQAGPGVAIVEAKDHVGGRLLTLDGLSSLDPLTQWMDPQFSAFDVPLLETLKASGASEQAITLIDANLNGYSVATCFLADSQDDCCPDF